MKSARSSQSVPPARRARKQAAGTTGRQPTVVVFGATVAGLTAAQRLAERGFAVTVLRGRDGRVLPEDLDGVSWARPPQIQAFSAGGPGFPRSAPLPPERAGPVLLNHFRHLRALLADIPSGKSAAATKRNHKRDGGRVGNTVANVLETTTARPWLPLRSEQAQWVAFAVPRPENVEALIESAKEFLAHGYTVQDGQTFWTRVLRFLTSSSDRRSAECEDVSMADYLRGARPAVSPRFKLGQRFADELQGLPELSLGLRPVRDEARAALGWYAQWLASAALGSEAGAFHFPDGIGESWAKPWLRYLRKLKVRFADGELDELRLQPGGRGKPPGRAKTSARQKGARVRAVLAPGCAPVVRALVNRARYLLVATSAADAERACSALPTDTRADRADPTDDVPRLLRGFTSARGSRTRWRTSAEIQLFLPEVRRSSDAASASPSSPPKRSPREPAGLDFRGPLLVVGSPWQLVARREWTLGGGAAPAAPAPFAAVLSVEVQAWDVPAPATGKTAAACDDRELAREVWSQLAPALSRAYRRHPPLWFRVSVPNRPRRGGMAALRESLNVLPNDWVNRPGRSPPRPDGDADGAARARASDESRLPGGAPDGAEWRYENLFFAGDYLKTLTRIPGPEAACESALHAVNAIVAHATRGARPLAAPPCAIFDPEDHEPAIFASARTLDAWLFSLGLPHAFEITGLDGWLAIAAWLSNLDPATEPFLKTVMSLVGGFPGAEPSNPPPHATSFQELGLGLLRRMREALEKRSASD